MTTGASQGRRRIAYVVFNDVYRDSRVLKMADSAADAGNDVRVFAFGGPLSHFAEGLESRESGAQILRLGVLPDRLPFLGRLVAERRSAALQAKSDAGPPQALVAVDAAPLQRRSSARIITSARRFANRLISQLLIRARIVDFDWRVSREILRWQPDLLHAHDANTLKIAMRCRSRAGVPFVYDAHELWEHRNAVRTARARASERRLLDRATRVMAGSVTVSPGIQNWMVDRYQLTVPPVLVRNIPPAPTNPASRSGGRLRELAHLPTSARILVYVGRITTGRGLAETVSSLALLPHNVHLVILGYGDPAFTETLRTLAVEMGVDRRVHFIGSVDSDLVASTIADADASVVYTQPLNLSYEYSLPNKLFESIHAGQAIVACDLPDTAELVNAFGVGVTFPTGDVEALAAAIEAVLRDPEAYQEASVNASRELTWENEFEKLSNLYDRIAPRASRSVRPRILCISLSPIGRDARVLRQIDVLSGVGDVTTVGYGPAPARAASHIRVPDRKRSLPETPVGVLMLAGRMFSRAELSAPGVRHARRVIADQTFDLIVANDARVLPLAFDVSRGAPVWADLHEWAPEERTHVLAWRLLVAPFMVHICRRYLPQVTASTTVGPQIASLYADRFGVKPEVMRNTPPYVPLAPSAVEGEKVRLVHSGAAVPGRHLELMILAMTHLDERFSLDLYLVPTSDGGRYLAQLRQLAAQTPRVTFHDPVAPSDLPNVLNSYDVGVFWIPPVHTNARLTLPNKFFDYVQARLAVAVGPSVEMASLVERFGIGVVSEGFSVEECARSLESLTSEALRAYKQRSDNAALSLSFDVDRGVGEGIARRLLDGHPSLV